jgi:hypothetical protein
MNLSVESVLMIALVAYIFYYLISNCCCNRVEAMTDTLLTSACNTGPCENQKCVYDNSCVTEGGLGCIENTGCKFCGGKYPSCDGNCSKTLFKMDGQLCSEIKVPPEVYPPESMNYKDGTCKDAAGSRHIEMLREVSPSYLTELCGDSCCTETKYVICSENHIWDGKKCEECLDTQIVENGKCQCPENNIWDGAKCKECLDTQIVKNGKCQCPKGYSWNYEIKECVPSCVCAHFISTGDCSISGYDGVKYRLDSNFCNSRLSETECTKDNKGIEYCTWSPQLPAPPPPACNKNYKWNKYTKECEYCPNCY